MSSTPSKRVDGLDTRLAALFTNFLLQARIALYLRLEMAEPHFAVCLHSFTEAQPFRALFATLFTLSRRKFVNNGLDLP